MPRKIKRTPPPPTPEQVAAAAAEQAAHDVAWADARRLAARLIREHGAPLFGVDIASPRQTAEEQIEEAHKDRLVTVTALLQWSTSPEADVIALVSGAGDHGSDRFAAVWWAGINIIRHIPRRGDSEDCARRLMAPLGELVSAGVVRREALDAIRGRSDDLDAYRRAEARKRTAAFLDEMTRLAGEDVA